MGDKLDSSKPKDKMGKDNNVIFNRFRLLSKLGTGSFGSCFKTFDTVSNRLVAIKIESAKGSQHSQLKTEYKIYKAMESTLISRNLRWPKMHYFGTDDTG